MFAERQATPPHVKYSQYVKNVLDNLNLPYRIGFDERHKAITVSSALALFIHEVQPSKEACLDFINQLLASQPGCQVDFIKLLPNMNLVSGVDELLILTLETAKFSVSDKHVLQPLVQKYLNKFTLDKSARIHYALMKYIDMPESHLQDYFQYSLERGHVKKVQCFLRLFPNARHRPLGGFGRKQLPIEIAREYKRTELESILSTSASEAASVPKLFTQSELSEWERRLSARERALAAQVKKLAEAKRALAAREAQLNTKSLSRQAFKPA